MPTRNRRRVAATVAALGLAGMLFAVGADSMVAAGHQIRPEQTSSACSTPTDEVVLTSVDQVAGLIDGTWIRCDGPPLFGDGTEGEVGVDVVGDRFYRVYRAADGSLIRAEGIDQEGALAILDTTGTNGLGSYQTNWKLLGQGTAIFRPSFFQSPSVMGLRMTGTAHYERWTGAAPTPGVPPGTSPSACGDRITPIALTSVAQAHDLRVGLSAEDASTDAHADHLHAEPERLHPVAGDRTLPHPRLVLHRHLHHRETLFDGEQHHLVAERRARRLANPGRRWSIASRVRTR